MHARCLRTFWRLALGLLLVAVLTGPGAEAHESRPAYLRLAEVAPSQFEVLWRTPTLGSVTLPVVLQMPKDVRNIREPLVHDLSDSRLERRWIDAGPEGLSGARIGFPGLDLTITEAIVQAEFLDGRTWMAIARPGQPWVELAADRGAVEVIGDFLGQGVDHILSGFDHLLFVFGLLLLVPGPWMLVKTVTAFTLAHSITLAAATLGYVTAPPGVIEPAIALSIVFLGVEIVRSRRGETSLAIRQPWIVAFLFGLLHGFGFAGVLTAAGLPSSNVPLALRAFNVGVELGQLAFVGLCLAGFYLVRRMHLTPRRLDLFPAYVVGTLGAFWLFQRMPPF